MDRKNIKFKKPANNKNNDTQHDQTALCAINLRLMSAMSGRMKASWMRKAMPSVAPTAISALSLPVNCGLIEFEMNCMTVMTVARQPTSKTEPRGSSLRTFLAGERCRKTAWLASLGKMKKTTVSDPTATGTLIQNAQRHPQCVEMTPPRMGPETVQTPMNSAPKASRKVRCPLGDETPIIRIAPLMMPAAPVPEMRRPAMNAPDVCAVAQMIEPHSKVHKLMKKIHLMAHNE